MKCYAKWEEDDNAKIFFRDQTILQFGNSWDLIANLILLNPGSALPLNNESKTDYLRSQELPFFIEPKQDEMYVEFKLDPLMRNILNLFSSHYHGGTIKIYNLFNLKNQDSTKAIEDFQQNLKHSKMFTADSDILYCAAPVIVASGTKAKSPELLFQLIRHIRLASSEKLFVLDKKDDKLFHIKKAVVNASGYVDSFHPSFTLFYGNKTELGELPT
ncbi:hypothetical protein MAMP_00073 [Methylophaga aminisulfidivorans MP]|jgi:hypothetical protein|uniref:Uncharacterized protein n=1 Tax=Methylophaga aminisulfidivorans MP TaxID=1026882 RepID=F5T0K5_9GAMM|nr:MULTISPECIES: hypothetical protein [Methylophaga]EGL53847.1 hypothetical protein MAMP_00073 [Methylophaga aminisulfidivorans MP]HIC46375.1 hypothetical protein [Methylophaga sp.]